MYSYSCYLQKYHSSRLHLTKRIPSMNGLITPHHSPPLGSSVCGRSVIISGCAPALGVDQERLIISLATSQTLLLTLRYMLFPTIRNDPIWKQRSHNHPPPPPPLLHVTVAAAAAVVAKAVVAVVAPAEAAVAPAAAVVAAEQQ